MSALNANDAAHLLRRSGFGGGGSIAVADRSALTGLERSAAVDLVLSSSNVSGGDPPDAYNFNMIDSARLSDTTLWWLDRIRTSRVTGRTAAAPAPSPIQEKMTLFWHGHFASSNEKVASARAMYEQNRLFRTEALGAFETLCTDMASKPRACEAMLQYLDNDENTMSAPNENFARELMELFTLGVNKYTQDDVTASARAWTGWWLDYPVDYNPVLTFRTAEHDSGTKTFMGVTKNWNGPDIIHHLCAATTVNPATGETPPTTLARFIARKVWSFFAYPNPDAVLVEDIATKWRATGFNITALLRDIFNRDEFYSQAAKQGLVRSPVEFVTAVLRSTGISARTAPPLNMADMGQALFYPPNVSGWRQNAYWLTTTGTWARATYLSTQIGLRSDTVSPQFLQGTLTMTVPNAVQFAFDACGIDSPSSATRGVLENWLTNQRAAAPSTEWTHYQSINLGILAMLSPDFQLA